jgi:hypothetical protein
MRVTERKAILPPERQSCGLLLDRMFGALSIGGRSKVENCIQQNISGMITYRISGKATKELRAHFLYHTYHTYSEFYPTTNESWFVIDMFYCST